jgi:hypothetical protein
MFKNYYNQSIKKLVVVFGNLFNEIYIQKTKENNDIEKIRVPMTYSPKEKFYRRIREASSISDNVKNQITLPRISFSMQNAQYDAARKLNKSNTRTVQDSQGNKYSISQVVPYIFTFELATFTKNIDDNLQIMEQILPYFGPELVIKMKFNPVYESVDVPITLDRVTTTEDYDGTLEERRIIISSYAFSVKSYIYGPINDPTLVESTTFDNVTFQY